MAVRGCILPNECDGLSGVPQRRIVFTIEGFVKNRETGGTWETDLIRFQAIAWSGFPSRLARKSFPGMRCNRTWKENRLHTLFA